MSNQNETSDLMDVVTPFLMSRSVDEGIAAVQVGMQAEQPAKDLKCRTANSTSTIYANSTISKPNEAEVTHSVGAVLQCIMMQNAHPSNGAAPEIDSYISMFDERSYIKQESRKRLRWALSRNSEEESPDEGVPPLSEICYFVMACSQRASFSSECSIIALVLLNRLLTTPRNVQISLHAYNWRLFFLTSLMLAQKIWEDVSLANIDFPIIWRHAVKVDEDNLDVRAFNNMESRYLELLNFNVYVSTSLYGQFCFELRNIHNASSKNPFPIAPLTPEGALRLEASTALDPEVLRKQVKGNMSKSVTSEVRGKIGQFVIS